MIVACCEKGFGNKVEVKVVFSIGFIPVDINEHVVSISTGEVRMGE